MQSCMYSNISFQNVKIIRCTTFSELGSTPFHIHLESGNGSFGEICLHLENAKLAEALVKSINETLKSFELEPVAETPAKDDIAF